MAMPGLIALGLASGCSLGHTTLPVPGAELRERIEVRLARQQTELSRSLGHYARVYDVQPKEVTRFLLDVYPRSEGEDLIMGGLGGIELHGGGVLEIMATLWQPGGRPARLSDTYSFAARPGGILLRDIYDSLRRQLFLPVPNLSPEQIDGTLPSAPALARLRVQHRENGRLQTTELDAFNSLLLLLRFEHDIDAQWTNALGQNLTTRTLMEATWDHALLPRTAQEEFSDHSNVHLVEVLLGYHRRLPPQERRDLNELKLRLLEIEFTRRDYGPMEPSEAWGHTVEALGLLLAEPDLHWSEIEKADVRHWLSDLELNRMAQIDEVPLPHLAHFWRGLTLIQAHAARLQ